jgi:hypothetical protein
MHSSHPEGSNYFTAIQAKDTERSTNVSAVFSCYTHLTYTCLNTETETLIDMKMQDDQASIHYRIQAMKPKKLPTFERFDVEFPRLIASGDRLGTFSTRAVKSKSIRRKTHISLSIGVN